MLIKDLWEKLELVSLLLINLLVSPFPTLHPSFFRCSLLHCVNVPCSYFSSRPSCVFSKVHTRVVHPWPWCRVGSSGHPFVPDGVRVSTVYPSWHFSYSDNVGEGYSSVSPRYRRLLFKILVLRKTLCSGVKSRPSGCLLSVKPKIDYSPFDLFLLFIVLVD